MQPNPPLTSPAHVLWCGPVLAQTQFANPAVSAAAAVWQGHLIQKLQAKGLTVHAISHGPQRAFPMGPLRVSARQTAFATNLIGVSMAYWNLPRWREWQWEAGYRHHLAVQIQSHRDRGHPFDCIVSYNAEHYLTRPIAQLGAQMQIPWFAIVADLPKADPAGFLARGQIARATGRVFLSIKNYEVFGNPQRDLFFEGGVVPQFTSNTFVNDGVTRIAYFGGYTDLGGVRLVLEAASLLTNRAYEFHFVGAGKEGSAIDKAAQSDRRIVNHGALPQEALINLGQRMDIFVDPRPTQYSENNFPSKLLTYLGFAKPIISTMGLGVPSTYHAVLLPLDPESAPGLARRITEVVDWSSAQKNAYIKRVHDFVLLDKCWDIQAQRFYAWMQNGCAQFNAKGR